MLKRQTKQSRLTRRVLAGRIAIASEGRKSRVAWVGVVARATGPVWLASWRARGSGLGAAAQMFGHLDYQHGLVHPCRPKGHRSLDQARIGNSAGRFDLPGRRERNERIGVGVQ